MTALDRYLMFCRAADRILESLPNDSTKKERDTDPIWGLYRDYNTVCDILYKPEWGDML